MSVAEDLSSNLPEQEYNFPHLPILKSTQKKGKNEDDYPELLAW